MRSIAGDFARAPRKPRGLAPLLMTGACAVALCAASQAFAADGAAQADTSAQAQAQAQAQGGTQTPASKPASKPDTTTVQEVVVTGVRRMLTDQAAAKRNSADLTDSIYAEDIGKFPDLNLAEAVNRIPGVTISRDVDGEGEQISIRGLGTNFTKITLNGSQIAVASDGSLDASNSNREVDLDMFPTELFTNITVYKSMEARLLDGGSSGNVDMVSAHPFDNPGQHLAVSYQEKYSSAADRGSPTGSLIASKTWGDKFGLLFGVAGAENPFRMEGFETIGWTTPRGYSQNGSAFGTATLPGCTADNPRTATSCNTTNPPPAGSIQPGGAGFTFATTMPSGVALPPGATAGQPVDFAALNPGISSQQLSNALFPRLGREVFDQGSRDRLSFLTSAQLNPTKDLKFSLDFLYGLAWRQFDRLDMDWAVRNGGGSGPNSTGMVPAGVTVDNNDVLTGGAFYNSQFFLEARPYQENLNFMNINPSMSWRVNDWLKVTGQVNYNQSIFNRYEPSYLFLSPMTTVTYSDNNTDGIPTIKPGMNLNDPNAGWTWYRDNVQNIKRVTHNFGTHWDFVIGDDKNALLVGVAYDDVYRKMMAFDASTAMQNCLESGTTATYSEPGNRSVTFNCPSSGISTAQIPNYLSPGPAANYMTGIGLQPGFTGFVTPNYTALNKAAPLSYYNQYAPYAGTNANNVASGDIDEKTTGFYLEAKGETEWLDHRIRWNAGGRYFHTAQAVTTIVSEAGQTATVTPITVSPTGAPTTGAPVQETTTVLQPLTLTHDYDAFLPSFNVTVDLTRDLYLKMAGSRTVTRPNPSAMLPVTSFADPAAQTAQQGNPKLAPYYSDNFDVGLEYYFSKLGYVAFNEFYKSIDGYTYSGSYTEPFGQLGIPLSSLTALQQATGISNDTLITVNTQVNAPGTMIINGQELSAVVPFDWLPVKGFGLQGTLTHVDWSTTGQGVPPPTGVPHYTYNLIGWYENHGLSVRVTWNWQDSNVIAIGPQNNVNDNYYADAYGQLDLSAQYTLPWWGGRTALTFNATNITDEAQRTYVGYERATYTYYNYGSYYMAGVRMKF